MKKISKVLALVLIVALTLTMFAACGKKSDKGGSGEYTGPELELLVSSSSTNNENCIYLIQALDRIKERTGGKVTYKLKLNNGGFTNATSAADELGAGLVDIGDVTLQNNPSYFPYTNQSAAQPFLGFKDIFSANDIMRDVLITNPNELMQAEFDNLGIIPFLASANFGTAIAMVSEADMSTPAGFKGQRIMVDNELLKSIVREAGGVESNQLITDSGNAFKNGLVEGAFNSTAVFKIFSIAAEKDDVECLAKYLWTFDEELSTTVKMYCISQVKWDSWDPSLQKIVKEEFGDALYKDFVAWVHTKEDPQWDYWAKRGEPIIKNIEGDNLETWKTFVNGLQAGQLEELRKTAPKIDDAIKIWKDAIAKYYAEHPAE